MGHRHVGGCLSHSGYLLLLALVLAIKDIDQVLHSVDAAGQPVPTVIVLSQALGDRAGSAFALLLGDGFCGPPA